VLKLTQAAKLEFVDIYQRVRHTLVLKAKK
jgi:hypothetical protein